ncbi:MAG: glycosyl transferase [Desulfuromonadales bacterium GWD2_61_12]|nr:MAG: glycosyl transferase [Desulfuromonadales bacterium GWC2_61_20]OGR35395.1 MAG: glycosyl transferase [Desulfuromonadales bacterium GWD2_61_12]HAD03652.1 glycosyl transferase [Desulfuromonas sp.]HBT83907.1 glycosyl transferase [Desulfuromonas sp.]
MRVVQLLPELNEGGVERGVVELSRELVRQGVESIVISRGGRLVSQLEADGGRHVTFDLAGKNPFTAPQRVIALRRLLRELRPDILHARSRVPAWLAWLANRPLKLPFVTTVHGFNSVNRYSRVMTFGERVICVSGAIKTHVQQHYAVPEGKLVVIPRGVDLNHFDPEHLDRDFMSRFAAEHSLAGRFVVTCVGRITQLKDYETFIRAIALLRKEIPEVLGVIVGGVHEDKKNYFASLRMLIKSQVLEQHVRFVGSQSRVAEIYALSDVVVSSSKKPESFGRSAAEALAMGVPVAASAHGGMLDIVREGETGALFPPGDAASLALAIKRSRDLPRAGLRAFVASNFTLARMVEQTLDVYRQLHGFEPIDGSTLK